MTLPDPAPVVSHAWVWRSRWLVALTHGLVVVWSVIVGLPVAWPWALGALAVSVLSNGWMSRLRSALPAAAVAGILALDLVLLTLLLLACGGMSHPFAFLYLFQVVVAAMVLETRWVAALVVLAAAGYGALFLPPPHHASHGMHGHYVGMWVAFAVTGPFAAFVVTRVRVALAQATARMAEARQLQERTERLSALGTLAAGAAHELATPLASIAVVASDLARRVEADVAADAATIREQVERCRQVLAQLAADSGHGLGQPPAPIRGSELIAGVMEGLDLGRVQLTVAPEAAARTLTLPVGLVAQAARQLVVNALEASPGRVEVGLAPRDGGLELTVRDEGPGMSPDVLARATEPFFTTKPVGQGSGLGLHFVRSVAEQVGGALELSSSVGVGTRAGLVLPGPRT